MMTVIGDPLAPAACTFLIRAEFFSPELLALMWRVAALCSTTITGGI